MRVVLHPGGIAACVFVWICWMVAKTATNILFFNVLFLDASTADSLGSSRGSASVQLPLTCYGSVLKTLFECVTWLGLLSHLGAIFTDPGSTKKAPFIPPANFMGKRKYCAKCEDRWKPPRAHHCTVCNECIMKMDHHCPWVNNCIGSMNQKYFFLFLAYMALSCLLNIGIILFGVGRFMYASPEQKTLFIEQWTSTYPGWLAAVLLGACLLIDVVFLLITLDFLSEQWEALETNATLVETYRNTHGKRSTLWEHAVAVFGRQWWLWWLPVPPKIVPNWTDPEVKDERSPQSSYAISSAQDFISEAEDADQHGERQRDPRQGGHDKPNTQGLAYLRRGMGTSAPDCETEEKETQGAAEIGAVSPEDEKMC